MKKLIFSVALILSLGLAGCGNDTTNLVSKLRTQTPASATTSDNEKEVANQGKSIAIKSGTYKVGTDLDAGEYLVVADAFMVNVDVSKDSSGTLDSILFKATLSPRAHIYVTVQDGELFKVDGGKIYLIADAPSLIPNDGVYKNGQYKVGTDIPAGEYKYVLESTAGIGYLEVSSNSRHDLTTIVSNNTPRSDGYITVSNGQYLTLQDVYIESK
ncbi:hypothetical protein ACIQ2D_09910 [Lysinibacillus sp. NPDC097287]|uniref:hypothetical protein n=1 Tax=Lysinibacillus sp. NPDC097287 TaxID=3364144 RepID=UPI003805F3FC